MSNQHTSGWKKQELDLLIKSELPSVEVAAQLGRSPSSVRAKRLWLRKAKKIPGLKLDAVLTPPNLENDKVIADNAYWRNQYRVLETEYKKSLSENVVVDRLIADIKSMAPTSYKALPAGGPVRLSKIERQTPESAVLLLSDTHVGKVVRKEQTLGFSEYNFPTFLARLKYVETTVLSILESHTTAPVDELVLPLLGDMLDGALAHGSEAGQRNVVFNQFYGAAHALALFVRNIASRVPKIRIVTVVGNHTRWGTQKKMPTENRYSNLDMFLYAMIQALTKDIPNVEWTLDEQPFSVFKVQGWTFFASHGDNLKGGDKALGIPSHAMARQMNATTQLFHKHGDAVPHYYVCGHFHRAIQLPTGLGDITVNGGFPGLDGYALDGNFNPVDPTQVFFRVHPKYGKIAEYKLQLKYADLSKPNYELPSKFRCE